MIELAHKKTSYPWAVAFTKGILCNWLVCLAVWQGACVMGRGAAWREHAQRHALCGMGKPKRSSLASLPAPGICKFQLR